jgi:hypothetical protein
MQQKRQRIGLKIRSMPIRITRRLDRFARWSTRDLQLNRGGR